MELRKSQEGLRLLQRPRLRPHIEAMRARLAEAMGTDIGRVSVKATTGEEMGFEGRGEGASASAVCLLNQSADGP